MRGERESVVAYGAFRGGVGGDAFPHFDPARAVDGDRVAGVVELDQTVVRAADERVQGVRVDGSVEGWQLQGVAVVAVRDALYDPFGDGVLWACPTTT